MGCYKNKCGLINRLKRYAKYAENHERVSLGTVVGNSDKVKRLGIFVLSIDAPVDSAV